LLVLYYNNWVGTPEEFKEYIGRTKSICDGIKGVNFRGVFMPSSEWNAVLLVETTSFDKVVEAFRTYTKKYGPHPKIPLSKVELLYTFEELGYPP